MIDNNSGKRKAVECSDGRVFESLTAAALAIVFERTGYSRPANARFPHLDYAAADAWNDADMLKSQIQTRISKACRTGGRVAGYHWKYRPDLEASFAQARQERMSDKKRQRMQARSIKIRERLAGLDDDFGLLGRSDDELIALYKALT